MTRKEKIQLQKLIRNLPQDNLERVVGILGRSDSSKTNLRDAVSVDLEKEVRQVMQCKFVQEWISASPC